MTDQLYMPKRVYIETVGCQMNVLDSELIVSGLVQAGYEVVDSPRDADTILYNTCSVRQHAEDKIYHARWAACVRSRSGSPRPLSACWVAWPRRTRT